jgi:hypothetical protein
MMRHVLALMVVAVGMAAASMASADPRDSVDRGDRMDTNALRDDVATDRLKVPSHPLIIAPPQQPVATSRETKGKKSGTSSSK